MNEDQQAPNKPSSLPVWLLIIGLVLSGVVQALSDDYDLIDEPPMWPALVCAACLAAPASIWAWRSRGIPVTNKKERGMGLVVVFGAIFVGAVGGWGGFLLLNAALDDEVTSVHATVQKREHRREQQGKSTRDVYYVIIDKDLATGEPGRWDLEITPQQFGPAKPGDDAEIEIGSGYFGVRYVVGSTLHPKPIENPLPSAADAIRKQ